MTISNSNQGQHSNSEDLMGLHFSSDKDNKPHPNEPIRHDLLGKGFLKPIKWREGSDTPPKQEIQELMIYNEKIALMVLSAKSACIAELTEQLAYIVVSQSLSTGTLKKLSSEILRSEIVRCDETMIFAALMGMPKLLNRIADKAGKNASALKFPTEAHDCRNVLMGSFGRRTFSLGNKGSNNNWFYYAANLKFEIEFTNRAIKFLTFIVKPDPLSNRKILLDIDNLALLFQGAYPQDMGSAKVAELCRLNKDSPSLISIHKQAQQFKAFCQNHIKGQELAINEVVSMISSAFSSRKKGPLGIATFMGTPGTGKTALAETIVDGLNEVFAAGYRKLMVNMELYTDNQSVMKLFGSGSQYVDSALGDLTSEVYVVPKTVIIFDEVEKAHSSVIQSLLTVLEKGEVRDYTSNKMVDFSQCILVFTTNLGNKAATKALSNDTPLDLKSLLSGHHGEASLSPELISRLSRGHVVFFRELAPEDIMAVAEQAAKTALLDDSSIQWPDNVAELIIETLGGNLEPRAILSQAAKLQRKIIETVCSSSMPLSAKPLIEVEIPEDLSNFHFAVICSDTQLKKRIKSQFGNCKALCNIAQLEKMQDNDTIQAVLIHRPLLDIQAVLPHYEKIKLYSFDVQTPIAMPDVAIKGINKNYVLSNDIAPELDRMIQQIAKRTRLLNKANEYRARNMVVSFDHQLSCNESSFKVTLANPRYELLFAPQDFEPVYMQEPSIPKLNFDDLTGLDELKQEMSVVLSRLRNEHDFELDMPKGYLMAGSPGTGKSYFAKAVAGECKVPFIPVNSADLMHGSVGENINHLFDVAERYAPCIVFLDEIDAIALNRNGASHLGHLAVNTLLTRLDGFNTSEHPVFILAATNTPTKLDPAVVRFGRFDKLIQIPAPDLNARVSYMKSCAADYRFEISDQELLNFAKRCGGATFGLIKNMFREIQMKLITNKTTFHPQMLNEQLLASQLGQKKQAQIHDKEKQLLIAYHETGHYLLAKHWFPKAQCVALSIEQFGHVGGFTQFEDGELHKADTITDVKAQLQILLAGRAAEDIFCKNSKSVTNGAVSDLQLATEMAYQSISRYGFSLSCGIADFSQLPTMQAKVESEVVEWVGEALKASKNYLQENWHYVEVIAQKLHEKKSLSLVDIQRIEDCIKSSSSNLTVH